ncbi:MAG: hypothetical protein R6U50_07320 [Desulfobacterales bacterium]
MYVGLAGFYLLRDDNEYALIDNGTLPSGDQEMEIVIQDRVFDANGQLKLPVANAPEETHFPDPIVPSITDLAGEPFLSFDYENDNSIVAEYVQAELFQELVKSYGEALKSGIVSGKEHQDRYDMLRKIDFSQLPYRQIVATGS